MTRLSILCVAFLAACGSSSDQAADAGAQADAQQLDAAVAHDAAVADTSVSADAQPTDAAVADAAVADAADADADADAALDSGAQVDAEVVANPCTTAGGACVETTTFCSDTLGGQVTRIACGSEGGICCIPIRPTCENIGTRSEGWYRSSVRDCFDQCEDESMVLPVRADFCGTVNEGWYTNAGSGCDMRTGRIALDAFACGEVPSF